MALGNQMGAVLEKGPDKLRIGDKCDFFLLTSVGISKGLEDVNTG